MDQTQIITTSQTLITAIAALLGLGILVAAGLQGWQGWLMLRTHELDLNGHAARLHDIDAGPGTSLGRIELADLKERVRRLEAIAAGVDL